MIKYPECIGKEIWTLCEPPRLQTAYCAKTLKILPPRRQTVVAIFHPTMGTESNVFIPIENLELIDEFAETVKFISIEEFTK